MLKLAKAVASLKAPVRRLTTAPSGEKPADKTVRLGKLEAAVNAVVEANVLIAPFFLTSHHYTIMIRASSIIALLLTLCHTAWCFSALSGPIILFILYRRDGDATGIMASRNVLSTYPTKNENNNNNNLAHPRSRRLHPRIRCPCRHCCRHCLRALVDCFVVLSCHANCWAVHRGKSSPPPSVPLSYGQRKQQQQQSTHSHTPDLAFSLAFAVLVVTAFVVSIALVGCCVVRSRHAPR
jgi:hypothetical protein